ncbi:MAG TPA: class I SAM-dependent methyltransferase [Candidatus Limnocylindrales bacterium]|nr:class I SAM-dependent methyltransferase [Candidatus Limnocylindrales bacterium]
MTESAAAALARLYDLDLSEDPGDLDLLLALAARAGGPVLELAVGSGRLAVPLAENGHEVTGVDLDPAMLARARDAADARGKAVGRRVRLVEGDARTVRLLDAGDYRLAVIPLNSIFLMGSRADQQATVATMAAHLAPGGLAMVDAWLPDADDLSRYDGRLVLEWVREDPGSGRVVTKTGSALYDPTTASVRLTTIFEEGLAGEAPVRWVRVDRLRLVTPDELAVFAGTAGLVVETLAGDYELGDLDQGAERVVMVARKP